MLRIFEIDLLDTLAERSPAMSPETDVRGNSFCHLVGARLHGASYIQAHCLVVLRFITRSNRVGRSMVAPRVSRPWRSEPHNRSLRDTDEDELRSPAVTPFFTRSPRRRTPARSATADRGP